MPEVSANSAKTTIRITPEQLENGVFLDHGEVFEFPLWQRKIESINSLTGNASNAEIFERLQQCEGIIQETLDGDDLEEASNAFVHLCYFNEPIPEEGKSEIEREKDLISQEKTRAFKADFVTKNLERIEQIMKNKPDSAPKVLRNMGLFLHPSYVGYSSTMIDFFVRHYEQASMYWDDRNEEFFKLVFSSGNEEHRKWAFDHIVKKLKDEKNDESYQRSRAEILSYLSPIIYQAYQQSLAGRDVSDPLFLDTLDLFEEELGKYNLEASDMLGLWIDSNSDIFDVKIIEKNLQAIKTLEDFRPGASNVLWTEYGIADFGRYPMGILIWQYDNRNNPDIPYGIMVYPESDYNGAFYQQKYTLNVLFSELQNLGYGIRIFEAGSSTEVLRAISIAHKRFGEKQKISFAILGGHGTERNIEFGGRRKGRVDLEDVFSSSAYSTGRQLMKLKVPFVKNPTIILNSCSTGANHGIGHELSLFGAKVIGPDKATPIGEMHVKKDQNGNLDFDVQYPEALKAAYLSGRKIKEFVKNSNKSPQAI